METVVIENQVWGAVTFELLLLVVLIDAHELAGAVENEGDLHLPIFIVCSCSYKVKVCFDIAQYPVHWNPQSAKHFSYPGRPVHSGTNSASLGSILAKQQLRAKTIHSHVHHRL